MSERSTGVTVADVRDYVLTLPRAYEVFVRGRVKFRVGQIVFVAFSRDETVMGFGFPKEWRRALVENEPEKFMLPGESDMRFHWACVRLDAIDRRRCASSSSMPGRWSCPNTSRSPTPGTRCFRAPTSQSDGASTEKVSPLDRRTCVRVERTFL